MTATIADDLRMRGEVVFEHRNVFVGGGAITNWGRKGRAFIDPGPAHVFVDGEHYRYEQYQAHTLWGLRKMTRREIAAWRIKKALRRPV